MKKTALLMLYAATAAFAAGCPESHVRLGGDGGVERDCGPVIEPNCTEMCGTFDLCARSETSWCPAFGTTTPYMACRASCWDHPAEWQCAVANPRDCMDVVRRGVAIDPTVRAACCADMTTPVCAP